MIYPLCSHHPQPPPQRIFKWTKWAGMGWEVSKPMSSPSHRAAVQLSWHSWGVWQETPPIDVLTNRIKEGNLGKEAPLQAGTVAAWQGAFSHRYPTPSLLLMNEPQTQPKEPRLRKVWQPIFDSESRHGCWSLALLCSGSGFQGNQWLQEPCKRRSCAPAGAHCAGASPDTNPARQGL